MGATRPGRGVCRLLSTSRRDGRGRGRHHTAVSRAGAQGGRGVAAPPGWQDSPGATPHLRVADTERLPAAAPAPVTLKTEVRSHGQPPPRGARPGLQGTRALVPSAGHTLPAPPRRLPGTHRPRPHAAALRVVPIRQEGHLVASSESCLASGGGRGACDRFAPGRSAARPPVSEPRAAPRASAVPAGSPAVCSCPRSQPGWLRPLAP